VNESVGRGRPERGDREVVEAKATNLERVDGLVPVRQLVIVQASRPDRSGFAARNGVDAGRREIACSDGGSHPEEEEAQEGRGPAGTFTGARRHRTRPGESGPESDARPGGAGNRSRVTPTERGQGLGRIARCARAGSRTRDNPLKGEPWTWQRDETSPQGRQRSKPSRACKTPRTERQARAWELASGVDAAGRRRDEGSRKPQGRRSRRGRCGSQDSRAVTGQRAVEGAHALRSGRRTLEGARTGHSPDRGRRLEMPGKTRQNRAKPGLGTTLKVPITSRRALLRGADEATREAGRSR